MSVLDYLQFALKNTFSLFFWGVGLWLIIAFILQYLTRGLRCNAASILGGRVFCYLTIPGVVVHELSHALFCLIFRHKIEEIKLFAPDSDGSLGFVRHKYSPGSIYQRVGNFFIGTGPIWGGILILAFISWLLLPGEMLRVSGNYFDDVCKFVRIFFSSRFLLNVWSYLWLYLAFCIVNHLTLSRSDLSGALDGLVFIAVLTLIISFCFSWSDKLINWILTVEKALLRQVFGVIVLMILLIGLLAGLSRFLRCCKK